MGSGVEGATLRSNRRLRIAVVMLAIAVSGLAVGLGVVASSGGGSSGTHRSASSSPTRQTSTTLRRGSRNPALAAVPKVLVAITTGGTLEELDPSSGAPLRTLATGAVGDELSITPDLSTVYFESSGGCTHQIERVDVAGGSPQVVAQGSVPALSDDGSKLAYVRQPIAGNPACQGQSFSPSQYTLVVRDVATGSETTYPVAPDVASSGLPSPIDHLSWSANGQQLAVSILAPQDNEGWQVVVIHPFTDEYYFSGSGIPLSGTNPSSSYYREGVFMSNGELFVNRVCCSGVPPNVTSDLLLEVDPSTGGVVHQVAVGILTNDHSSLDADASGHWLLYLSGGDLLVSENGGRPTTLAGGFVAAAW